MFLMLVDTPDPRYRREPEEPEPEPERWHPNLRLWAPIAGSIVCFVSAYLVPPLVTFILTIAGLMLFFDGVFSLFPDDGLRSHRQ
jgi:hypothetical protein